MESEIMDAELYIIVVVDLGSDREIFDMFSISLIKTMVETIDHPGKWIRATIKGPSSKNHRPCPKYWSITYQDQLDLINHLAYTLCQVRILMCKFSRCFMMSVEPQLAGIGLLHLRVFLSQLFSFSVTHCSDGSNLVERFYSRFFLLWRLPICESIYLICSLSPPFWSVPTTTKICVSKPQICKSQPLHSGAFPAYRTSRQPHRKLNFKPQFSTSRPPVFEGFHI